LGFAVAAQMEPDILIIDEVLAVGDLAFKVKCYNTIAAILPRTAILFVSHSMPQISKLCTSSLLLNRGVVKEHSNNISAVINSYFCDSRIDKKENIICFGETKLIEKELIYNQKVLKESQVRVSRGSTFAIRMRLNVDKSVKNFFIRMVVYDAEFKGLVELNSLEDDFVITNTNDINDIQVNIENIFNSGEYNITLIVLELLKDNRIGKRLLVYEGFASINSVSLDSLHESYIPVTLNTNWIANN
jgi:lipopolysaccharide transport system ATP-binding protein